MAASASRANRTYRARTFAPWRRAASGSRRQREKSSIVIRRQWRQQRGGETRRRNVIIYRYVSLVFAAAPRTLRYSAKKSGNIAYARHLRQHRQDIWSSPSVGEWMMNASMFVNLHRSTHLYRRCARLAHRNSRVVVIQWNNCCSWRVTNVSQKQARAARMAGARWQAGGGMARWRLVAAYDGSAPAHAYTLLLPR